MIAESTREFADGYMPEALPARLTKAYQQDLRACCTLDIDVLEMLQHVPVAQMPLVLNSSRSINPVLNS